MHNYLTFLARLLAPARGPRLSHTSHANAALNPRLAQETPLLLLQLQKGEKSLQHIPSTTQKPSTVMVRRSGAHVCKGSHLRASMGFAAMRHTGQLPLWLSHLLEQPVWKRWKHLSVLTISPSSKSIMQIGQAPWERT